MVIQRQLYALACPKGIQAWPIGTSRDRPSGVAVVEDEGQAELGQHLQRGCRDTVVDGLSLATCLCSKPGKKKLASKFLFRSIGLDWWSCTIPASASVSVAARAHNDNRRMVAADMPPSAHELRAPGPGPRARRRDVRTCWSPAASSAPQFHALILTAVRRPAIEIPRVNPAF